MKTKKEQSIQQQQKRTVDKKQSNADLSYSKTILKRDSEYCNKNSRSSKRVTEHFSSKDKIPIIVKGMTLPETGDD